MKKLLFIFCFQFLVSTAFAAQSADLFSEANTQYQSGHFKEAAALYEKITAQGAAGASVYYNLGNAYFRENQKGRALASYERALRFLPRDRDLLWNINVLKSVLADHLETQGENILLFWFRNFLDSLLMDVISAGLAALLVLFAVFGAMNFFLPQTRRWLKGAQFLIVILFCLAAGLFAAKWADQKDPKVVVLPKEVFARYGPSEKETKAFLLHEGAEAKVKDQTRDWYYIALPNSNAGWVPKDSCAVV